MLHPGPLAPKHRRRRQVHHVVLANAPPLIFRATCHPPHSAGPSPTLYRQHHKMVATIRDAAAGTEPPPAVLGWLGPPPPRALTRLTRFLQLAVLAVMAAWIWGHLGGLRLTPRPLPGDEHCNDTSQLFNWHPLLLTIAFPLLMAEAVLAYKAPLVPLQGRCACLQSASRRERATPARPPVSPPARL